MANSVVAQVPRNPEAILTEIARRDRSTREFSCDPQSVGRRAFKFVVLHESAFDKKFNKSAACDLVGSYASHVYNGVAVFWPLKGDLGLELSVGEHKAFYNAFYIDNLSNPHFETRLGLIFIEGIPLEPQRIVWSHEYGHAVMDEYVRQVLNRRFGFDKIVRDAVVQSLQVDLDGGSNLVQLDTEFDDVYTQHTLVLKQLRHLNETINSKMEVVSKINSELGRLNLEFHNLDRERAEIRNLNVEIRNLWQTIENEQGHLKNYPEGQALLAAEEQARSNEFEIFEVRPFFSPNQEKIAAYVKTIENLKMSVASRTRFYEAKRSEAVEKQRAIERQKESLEKELHELAVRERPLRAKADTLSAKMIGYKVHRGIEKHKAFSKRGIATLPGLAVMAFYHEFFADLFAAVYHNDPNVIGDALAQIMGEEGIHADARRFAPLYPEKIDLDSWSAKMKRSPHFFFSPVRAGLGRDTIAIVNQRGLGKVFLKKVLDLIADSIADQTFNAQNQLSMPYEPVLAEVRAIDTPEKLSGFLKKVADDHLLESAFVGMDDLNIWCRDRLAECKNLLFDELSKKDKGLFTTGIHQRDANDHLLRGVQQILGELNISSTVNSLQSQIIQTSPQRH